MRKLAALLLFVCSYSVFAQKSPVDWQFQAQELNNNEFLIYCKAKISKNWYLYSQHIESTPPIPTTINITPNGNFKLLGVIEEKGALIDQYDEALDKNVKKYANQVSFIAKIKTFQPLVLIDGNVEFMTCDHEKCLPPETRPFQFKLQATRSEQLAIRKSAPTTIIAAHKYTSENYITPDRNINIPDPVAIHLTPHNKEVASTNVVYENSTPRVTSNAERTTVLENSGNMVAANVMNYFAKGKEVKRKQLLAEQTAKQQAKEKLLAVEAARKEAQKQAEVPVITEAPVDWVFDMVSLGDGIYELVANVKIAKNWFIYSKDNTGDAPFPLSLQFDENPNIAFLDENVQEIGELRIENDPLFNKEVKRYADEITFKRKVKFKTNTPIVGSVKFMAASNQQYLMPTEMQFAYNDDLSVVLPTQKSTAGWWIFGIAALFALITSTLFGQIRKMLAK